MPIYDVIIIGAGSMGSAAAYYLAQQGQNVLLMEQFDLDHKLGSSIDHTRIIRYSYSKPEYIRLMRAAYPLWSALEETSGEKLYYKTGGLDFGFSDNATLQATITSLQDMQIDHEILSPLEIAKRYPQFTIPDAMTVVYQADYGVLAAERAVKTHQRLAKSYGAEIRANLPVLKIREHQDSVDIETSDGVYSAGKLIITAGAWTNDLLKDLNLQLPLKPMRIQLGYFAPAKLKNYSIGNFPVFIAHIGGFAPYGIPSWNNSGLKVALHGGQLVDHVSQIDYNVDDSAIEEIRAFCRQYLPEADAPLMSKRVCLYTMTPDEDFILDRHPEFAHILIASPCSGHGFKFSTLFGSILSDLALHGKTEHDIRLFSLRRFL